MKVPLELLREWADRLKDSGFTDIEDKHGRLKQPNTRTKSWETKEATQEFFELLTSHINRNRTLLTRLELKILEMHCEGIKYEAIAFEVYRSVAYVKNTIYKHRKIILHKK